MSSPEIRDARVVKNQVYDAIKLEKVQKIGKAQVIYESTEDRDLKGLLYEFKLEEEAHLSTLMGLAEDLDMEVDLGRMEEQIWEARLHGENMRLCEELEVLRRQEVNCRDFYERLSRSIDTGAIDTIDAARVADTMERLAEEEREHLEGLEKDLNKINRLI